MTKYKKYTLGMTTGRGVEGKKKETVPDKQVLSGKCGIIQVYGESYGMREL